MSEQLPYLLYNAATGTVKKVERSQAEIKPTGEGPFKHWNGWLEYVHSLPSIPVHDDLKKVWKDNGKYYLGKDFDFWVCCQGYCDGTCKDNGNCKIIPIATTDKPQHQSVDISENDIINVISKVAGIIRKQDRGLLTLPESYKALRETIFPHMQPTHTSVDDLIKDLQSACNANFGYSLYDSPDIQRVVAFSINTLRELLSNKIITTPEAIEKVWKEARKVDENGMWETSKATYLKREFGIDSTNPQP